MSDEQGEMNMDIVVRHDDSIENEEDIIEREEAKELSKNEENEMIVLKSNEMKREYGDRDMSSKDNEYTLSLIPPLSLLPPVLQITTTAAASKPSLPLLFHLKDKEKTYYLPDDILIMILKYLSYKDICKLSQTCKYLMDVGENEEVWRILYFKYCITFKEESTLFDDGDDGMQGRYLGHVLQHHDGMIVSIDEGSERSILSNIIRRPSNLYAMLSPKKYFVKYQMMRKTSKKMMDKRKKENELELKLYNVQKKLVPFLEFFGWRLPFITLGLSLPIFLFLLVNNLTYLQNKYESISGDALDDIKPPVDYDPDGMNSTSSFVSLNETNSTYQPTSQPTSYHSPITPVRRNPSLSFYPWYLVFLPLDVFIFTVVVSLALGTLVYINNVSDSILSGLHSYYLSAITLIEARSFELNLYDGFISVPLLSWILLLLVIASLLLVNIKLEFDNELPNLGWTFALMPIMFIFVVLTICQSLYGLYRSIFDIVASLNMILLLLLVTLRSDGYISISLATSLFPFWIMWGIFMFLAIIPLFLSGKKRLLIIVALLIAIFIGVIDIVLGVKYPGALLPVLIAFVICGVYLICIGIFAPNRIHLIHPLIYDSIDDAHGDDDNFDDDDYHHRHHNSTVFGDGHIVGTLAHNAPSFYFSREEDVEFVINKLMEQAKYNQHIEASLFNSEPEMDMSLTMTLAERNQSYTTSDHQSGSIDNDSYRSSDVTQKEEKGELNHIIQASPSSSHIIEIHDDKYLTHDNDHIDGDDRESKEEAAFTDDALNDDFVDYPAEGSNENINIKNNNSTNV